MVMPALNSLRGAGRRLSPGLGASEGLSCVVLNETSAWVRMLYTSEYSCWLLNSIRSVWLHPRLFQSLD